MPDVRALLRRYVFDGEILRLMALVFLIKPLGLITQMLLAKYFGAGPEYDAYVLAIFIVMFSGSVLGQVFTSAVVPFVIKLRAALDEDTLLRFQNAILGLFAAPALLIAIVLVAGAGFVVDLVSHDLPAETRGYAVRIVRYLAVPGTLILLVAMGKAVLNLNRKYRLATGMPIVNAVSVLAAIVLLHEQMGIWSAVIGFAASEVIQTACVWLRAATAGHVVFRRPLIPAGRLRLLWSMCSALLLTQTILLLYQLIDNWFASSLGTGSLSSIAYALTIKNFGIQMFQLTLVTVMFTRMSEYLGAGDLAGCGDYVRDNIARVMRLVMPATLAFCLASGEIVRVLFLRGAFTPEDAVRTTGVMSMYALGLPAFIVNLIVGRVFHSLQRMREKIWLGVQYLVMSVALNALLIGPFKVMGLAMATTITIYTHVALAFWVLHRYGLDLGVPGWGRIVLRNHVLAVLTGLIYEFSGFGDLMADWSIRGSVPGDILIGVCKSGFVVVVFGALYLAQRVWARRASGSETDR